MPRSGYPLVEHTAQSLSYAVRNHINAPLKSGQTNALNGAASWSVLNAKLDATRPLTWPLVLGLSHKFGNWLTWFLLLSIIRPMGSAGPHSNEASNWLNGSYCQLPLPVLSAFEAGHWTDSRHVLERIIVNIGSFVSCAMNTTKAAGLEMGQAFTCCCTWWWTRPSR